MNNQDVVKIINKLAAPNCGHFNFSSFNMVKEVVRITSPKTILEIGFHAGFSATMWLAFSDAHLLSVDIATLPWLTWETGIKKSVEVLKSHFGNRFEFIIGDSQTEQTKTILKKRSFDLVFIDGNHDTIPARNDIQTAIDLGAKYVFLDDYVDSHPSVINAARSFGHKLELLRRFKLDNYDVGEYKEWGDSNNTALFKVND